MNQPFAELIKAHLEELTQRHAHGLAGLTGTFYERLTDEQRQVASHRLLEYVFSDIAGERRIEEYTSQLGHQRARDHHYTVDAYKGTLKDVQSILRALIAENFAEDSLERGRSEAASNDMLFRAACSFYEAYTLEREQALREREAELTSSAEEQEKLVNMLRELSSPIVPVHDSILVLPLVGAIDTTRAQTITEDLLEAIVARQADLVIIDITGVPVVDTSIANYLLQTTKAVNLLGAQVILVGISAEVAQTIVGLDLDLNRLTVRANLQDGIDFALSQLGLQIAVTAADDRIND